MFLMRTKNIYTISVITPSYNQGQFIEDTIKSVLIQKGDFYIDFIVQDGGSTDNSVNVIKKYEQILKKNCRTRKIDGLTYYIRKNKSFKYNSCKGISYRWVSGKDGGQIRALKTGFKKSKGDILCWLNSDDFFLDKDVFTKVFAYFKKDDKLKIVTGDGIFTDKEGNETGVHHVSRVNTRELIYLDYHILQPSTFIKREVYKSEYLQEKYNVAFDCYFYIKLLMNNKYLKVNDRFSAFRFYQENKTLGLAYYGFLDQCKIAWRIDKNPIIWILSTAYRYLEKVIKPKYEMNRRFMKFYYSFQKICYKIIINEKYEERF